MKVITKEEAIKRIEQKQTVGAVIKQKTQPITAPFGMRFKLVELNQMPLSEFFEWQKDENYAILFEP